MIKNNLVVAFLLFFLLLNAQKNNHLSLRLSKGSTFHRAYEQINEVDMGNNVKMSIKSSGVINYKTIKILKDGFHIEVVYDSLAIASEVPGGDVFSLNSSKIDSSNKVNRILSEMITGVKGKVFNAEVSKEGEIIKVSGLSEVIESTIAKLDPSTSEDFDKIKDTFISFFGEKNFVKIHSMLVFHSNSNTKTKKGKAWKRIEHIGVKDSVTIETTYNVEKTTRKYIFLEGKSTVTFNKNNFLSNINSSMYSNYVVDKKTGWILKSNLYQSISSDVPNQFHDHSSHSESKNPVKSRMTSNFYLSTKDNGFN